jgi:hypothetical protein
MFVLHKDVLFHLRNTTVTTTAPGDINWQLIYPNGVAVSKVAKASQTTIAIANGFSKASLM